MVIVNSPIPQANDDVKVLLLLWIHVMRHRHNPKNGLVPLDGNPRPSPVAQRIRHQPCVRPHVTLQSLPPLSQLRGVMGFTTYF